MFQYLRKKAVNWLFKESDLYMDLMGSPTINSPKVKEFETHSLTQVTAGQRLITTMFNQYYNLLKGVSGGEDTVIIANNASYTWLFRPNTAAPSGAPLLVVQDTNGTDQFRLTFDGSLWLRDGAAIRGGGTVNISATSLRLSGIAHAHVVRAASVVIANNTWTALSFPSARFDTDSMWNAASSGMLLINTPGRYLVGGDVIFAPNATGVRQVALLSGTITIARLGQSNLGAGVNVDATLSTVQDLAAGTQVSMQVYQNSGADLAVIPDSLASIALWAVRVG